MPVSPTYLSSRSPSPGPQVSTAPTNRRRSSSVEFLVHRLAPAATSPKPTAAPAEARPTAPSPAKRRALSPAPEPTPAEKRSRPAPAQPPLAPPPAPQHAWCDEEVANALVAMAAQSRRHLAESARGVQVTQVTATATFTTRSAANATASALPAAASSRPQLALPFRQGPAPTSREQMTLKFADVGNGPFLVTLPVDFVGPALASSVELTGPEPTVPLRINGWEMRMGLSELRSLLQALRQPTA